MWYRIKVSRNINVANNKKKTVTEYYLNENINFADAGNVVVNYLNGECEVEDVCLMKNLKPLGNVNYTEDSLVYIVKFAQDFVQNDGTIKTVKYPVPFRANNSQELQPILDLFLKQGLDDMRITAISETRWKIVE